MIATVSTVQPGTHFLINQYQFIELGLENITKDPEFWIHLFEDKFALVLYLSDFI